MSKGGHGHGHGHSHGHGHGHGHGHSHGEPIRFSLPSVTRAPLVAGEGRGKLLLLDTFSGIAGDMTIAALVDLGVPLGVIEDTVRALGLSGVRVVLKPEYAGAIGGSKFDVLIEQTQGERSYREIRELIAASTLNVEAKDLAQRIFRRLAEAEAEVHRMPVDEVSFHEVGAVDAIVDIVGAAAAFSYLGARVVSTPLPLGRGTVHCRHGILPLPAPATLLCLRGAPTVSANIEAELVTPTGAAIVATVAEQFVTWPALTPLRVGWGCGTQALPDRPNALRVVLGDPEQSAAVGSAQATHYVLETNIDDMTGELAAHAIEVLLESGALDAWATPNVMKKGRPGLVLSALAPAGAEDRLSEVMLRHTTSIGVRRIPATRSERPREIRTVTTRFGEIPVKVSTGPYGAPQVKPEFDACVRAARDAGVSVREVLAEVLTVAQRT